MGKKIEMIGKKFNYYTILDEAPKKGKNFFFKCVCKCGNIREVAGSHLRSGHTKSCGCLRKNKDAAARAKTAKKKCAVDGCKSKYYAKGYCERHYDQIKRYGKIINASNRTVFTPNPFVIEGNICRIVLFNKHGEQTGVVIIDTEDVNKCKKHKWFLSKRGYPTSRINGKLICLHKYIFSAENIDHIDRDRFNNRKSNLRECSYSQNIMNQTSRGGTGRYKGVWFDKKNNKWAAAIRYNNERKSLGRFHDEKEAALAYNRAAKKHHKEFACLNSL